MNAKKTNGITSDDIQDLALGLKGLRNAICEPAVPCDTPYGGRVGDLTEAMVYIGQAIDHHAEKIRDIAIAIERLVDVIEKPRDV